ncbi:MAG TPA: SDR family oxidoreductase [Hyphomonadaceae bacterium]|nr:SDR family oxidoreductase [Hyphomonadaceae bacterium]
MRVFVTGATGFIGSAVVTELLANGHQVLGLTRSEEGAAALVAAGAEPIHGSLQDLDSLRRGASATDGVIHTAFIHDFSKFQENCEIDRQAIEALGDALAGSNRTLVVSTGLPVPTEDDVPPPSPFPRVSEETALAQVERGVRAMAIRLPQVHDRDKQGLVSYLIELARGKGVSAYVGTGLNRWPAAHRLDVAPLYRLALEKGSAGARYHAVAEEGVSLREIAEAIGRGLKIPVVAKSPEDAPGHFGWMSFFAGADLKASSALTQQRLGWHPTDGPGMIADLDRATAFGR